MTRDSQAVLAAVLIVWTVGICWWSLWVMGPARRKRVQPPEPPPMPTHRARASRPRLTVLRGPGHG